MIGNVALGNASNYLITAAIVVYSLALLAYAADCAYGNHTADAQQRPERQSVPEPAMVGAASASSDMSMVGLEPDTADDAGAEAPPSRAMRVSGIGRLIGKVAIGFTILGWVAHGISVIARGLAADRLPWGNMYEFDVALSFAAVTTLLVTMLRHRARFLGVFVMTPVVLALGLAVTVLYVAPAPLVPALQSYWLAIHVTAAVVASGVFTIGTAATVMYLIADRYAAATTVGKPVRASVIARLLPAPETLDRTAYRAYLFAFPLWTFAVVAGAIWAEAAWGHYWQWDPKETWSFITWVIYAGYLHARATAGWRHRAAAYIAVIGYLAFLFNFFGVNTVIVGLHSYAGV